jgi:hypothetical protein
MKLNINAVMLTALLVIGVPVHMGTKTLVRSTSASKVANRYSHFENRSKHQGADSDEIINSSVFFTGL